MLEIVFPEHRMELTPAGPAVCAGEKAASLNGRAVLSVPPLDRPEARDRLETEWNSFKSNHSHTE